MYKRRKNYGEVVFLPKLSDLKPETRYELLGILLFTAGVLAFISLAGLHTGPFGLFMAKVQRYMFGIGALALPVVLVAIGSRYVWTQMAIDFSLKFWGLSFLYVLALTIFHHFKIPPGQEILPESLVAGGGLLGGMLLFFLRKLLGTDGSLVVLIGLAVCAIIGTTTWSLQRTLWLAKQKAGDSLDSAREAIAAARETLVEKMVRTDEEEPAAVSAGKYNARSRSFYNQEQDVFKLSRQDTPVTPEPVMNFAPDEPVMEIKSEKREITRYSLPPLSILKRVVKTKQPKPSKEITDNAQILINTLDSFGVSARMINTCQGPAVTRYELEPAPGVKVSKIVGLADDLALKLAATGVRIEAPIPGKAAIGIEVPNKDIAGVHLREVLESEEIKKASSKLTVALGKDIAGQAIWADLAKMPHLLVAGATGSGKSVCINTLITSILFRTTPSEVKFILIDPKVVELSNYNGIPHLMTPVVTDAKKAASSLNWAVQEMERRYAVFATAGVRDIGRYNETVDGEGLPLIVIIIDELADLMMAAPVDVEDAICRLAQKARAAGLHLVLATQRPSVDVITGTIKANVPSRISFAVSSQIDSRTILDMAGAEKLLGKGDMLFYPVGAPKPLRVQGAFISDGEVEELVDYIKRQAEPEYTEGITTCEGQQAGVEKEQATLTDELLEEAVRMVLETGQASVSMLQRKFRIGYTRAARLIDTMEEMRIVGPNMGSKAREILMTSDQIYARYFNQENQ
ncbi:DNA segregation ATPase FtsK/SpoIIIE, S-DNA-T family [Propionispora hippei DSM 15287]|uniref:DNA segregation ATPase FtsK/SpoIIIE, S-DNA-T family n=1 Tax=Propionispora hippei DSM 15287 TaxID=1123003 RepID=A0A1M6DA54_9FIRM|nr:DNA segregation ATPase FtsK/SpoIIIE, S-DNA-T family [Propionispora hippei DSM 15287]